MSKQLKFQEAARRALKRGVDVVADAVKTTLGPRGRNVALDTKYGAPTVTHDGVTVAKEIELKDPFENIGARLLVEVATKLTRLLVTALPPPRCWPRRLSPKVSRLSAPARTPC